jgi:hypothetical protein
VTPAITGHLLSSSFLTGRLGSYFRDAVSTLPKAAQLGPASSLRALLDGGVGPLIASAGLGAAFDITADTQRLVATAGVGNERLLLLVAAWGTPHNSHWRAAVEHAVRRSCRWCVLYNGTSLRLLDARRPHSSRFIEFALDAIADEPAGLAAVQIVLNSLNGSLDTLIRESDDHGAGVCRALKDGVLAASTEVLSALVRRRGPLDAALDQSLTIVYRLLFLLFAESRRLVPLWHPLYRASYSIDTLVAKAAREKHVRGLWDALRAISRLAHAGCRAGDLRVTPFNGRLFAPGRTPLAEQRGLDDERARRALLALGTRAAPGGVARERIAYRDLGVEQLGSVYESLLDYQPSADPIRLVPGSGVRKSTGTFYTPQPIAEYLVRATLGPLVRDAGSQEILQLRVVDPAMGSGAFLVAACRYLTQAYESALVREGGCHPADFGESDRVAIRRTIAERCLYGVDINPMAVQLARLSLWLTTLAADRPLTFLDHRLRTGDSLMGAWVDSLRHHPAPGARAGGREGATGGLFDEEAVERTLRAVLPIRFSLERTPDDTLDQVRAKERALASLEAHQSQLTRWKRIADVWCSAWLSDRVPPAAFNALSDHILSSRGALPDHVAAGYLDSAGDIASRRKLFHWELEFPEVFFDTNGRRLARPGFDAVIGNPPWEVVRGDREALSFHRRSRVYSASVSGHGNLYQLFAERAIALLRFGGRLGLVLPSGLATDHNAAQLRRRLLQDCDVDALVGLDNRRGVFAIHRSVKFLLTTATRGRPTTNIAARLGDSDPDSLGAAGDEPASASSWFPVRLTPSFLRRVSGEALSIPELRTPADVAIVERAATLFPPLGSDAGWGARFGRELNATDDRDHFGTSGLPVIEGKHIEPFAAHIESSRQFINARTARTLLPTAPFDRARLAYRDVASATNRLTLIAAILPSGCVSTHTLFCLRNPLPRIAQLLLCGLFNSLVVNYLVRLRVTTHVTTATVERLPIPPPGYSPSSERVIVTATQQLSRGFDRDAWIHLQTCVAGLYQLTASEFAHVLATFPLIADSDRHAANEIHLAAEAQRTQR